MNNFICIRNAKEHNLDNINLDLPKNSLIVITGVSGSGKSSLAFDTIYAEGQRKYVEGLSSYARQFLDLCPKPDVESITGLSPAISINQKSSSKNPRSTVSTITEIYDYLRLMYAKIGIPYSPITGKSISKQSVSQIIDHILNLPTGTQIYILGMIVKDKKGEYFKEIYYAKKQGYNLLKIKNKIYDINNIPQLDKNKKNTIYVVVDEISITENRINRISSSVESALKIGKGVIYIEIVSLPKDYSDTKYSNNQILVFSEYFACPETGFSINEIEPRLFSFNTIHGSCKYCSGLGKNFTTDINLVIPNEHLSISQGAIHPIGPINPSSIYYKSQNTINFSSYYASIIISLSKLLKFDLSVPWKQLPDSIKNIILYGRENTNNAAINNNSDFKGIINIINNKSDLSTEKIYEKYSTINTCSHCNGLRLSPEALSVKIDNKNIGELSLLSIDEAILWCTNLPSKLTNQHKSIACKLLDEIIKRLTFLQNVGLGYLTLDREAKTLSGGESQRIKLASQIGSGLTGVLYVLDEPSIGLHQRDNMLLINTLKSLRDLGNTVIVVEHDDETMLNADYIVDIGPGAGPHGGKLIAQGTLSDIIHSPNSITGQYLSHKKVIPLFKKNKTFHQWIEINEACQNNLRNINVKIPVGAFTCVTGVSGSGKSSLITNTLYKYAMNKLHNTHYYDTGCKSILGLENIDKVIEINQSPIGKTPLSNPATYIGLFTHIRTWFAGLPLSKARGYNISRFSFNTKGGRCEACKGDGYIKIEMHFLPDIYVKCDECKGLRYNRETLEVTYKNKSIADVLNMTVDQSAEFFSNLPIIKEKLTSLQSVGMGYIKIGQSSTTLSGGEAQRIKLSKELSKRSTGSTLYILDEPTTGLHLDDIKNLLHVLHKLSDLGNTVIVIEHNLHVIKTAEYIIDIGPGSGKNGGEVVAYGSPEEIVTKFPQSFTSQYLKPYLKI
ncbi:excinuclease ABC subunit UvrA [Candidatus Neoehrlichia procyonis]|uniref:UvrABC system protein A n=1 Tax=Candidatus Neoehrlichia procyonis str. RAC413 TaxID=1359163 RepID=A0A0F3NLQ4_9RICK|nr:excinuclease ABC subunit UvrA [Candidatus Neoehrlichia lotoris]KJV68701.1 excinuclease ABC subunit A [Candidatus Neoehrlichia lotoris str. RAC413]